MPSLFRKDSSSSPRMTEQIEIFIVPLKIHFKRSKSFLDSLKIVSSTFKRKPSVGASESGKKNLKFFGLKKKK